MHLDPAYIDPGSGSLIIQAVIATLVAIPIFFRSQIARATHAFRGRGAERRGHAAGRRSRSRQVTRW